MWQVIFFRDGQCDISHSDYVAKLTLFSSRVVSVSLPIVPGQTSVTTRTKKYGEVISCDFQCCIIKISCTRTFDFGALTQNLKKPRRRNHMRRLCMGVRPSDQLQLKSQQTASLNCQE